MTEGCADNIKIVIYLDEVLDGCIEIKAGQEENCLRITVKSNGDMTHYWNRTTSELTFTVEAGENHLKKVQETIQRVLRTNKNILRNHDATRKLLCKVRDKIPSKIKKYHGNVIVVIYLDEVLDSSIEINVGKAKDFYPVTINSNGDIQYGMKKTFWKRLCDGFKKWLGPLWKSRHVIASVGLAIVSLFSKIIH